MWTLFTTALARGNSTTQVSILNTSSNFVITALLGLAVFSESLPPLWWLGASLLVAGSVIVGRKDESATSTGEVVQDDEDTSRSPSDGEAEVVAHEQAQSEAGSYHPVVETEDVIIPEEEKSDDEEDIVDLGDDAE
jgi:hypothetical protein